MPDWAAKALDWFSLSAVVQVAILYLVIYAILKRAKGSRFGQVLMGVGILAAVLSFFTLICHFDVLSAILKGILAYLAISTVVIFQPEIRRALSQVGAFGVFGLFERRRYGTGGGASPASVAKCLLALASRRVGALVAFERGISLRSYEESGVVLGAAFSRELVDCIFTPPLPLHDGGVTIRDGRIAASHCVFPVSNNQALAVSGMRHRAAVGLSEETDALVVVVSEETGDVSVAHNGRIVRYPGTAESLPTLERWIAKAMSREPRANRLLARVMSLLQKGVRR